jgi:peptidoglycan/LPS O-acetylase OafA/YrhL
LAVRTRGNSGRRPARAAVVLGVASVLTLPLAIYATRFSDAYELLHAGFAIPVAGGLALLALAFARRARRLDAVRLDRAGAGAARVGRVLGILGLCLATSGLVALAVYGLLEYVGTRD